MQRPVELPRTPGWMREFKDFIMRGSVVDLAVGVIIGAAFTTIVNSLVKDVFNPILGLATGGIDFSNVFVPLNGKHYDSLAEAQHAGAPTVNIGLFINAVIQFLIVAFIIFWIVRMMQRLIRQERAAPAPTKSEVLLGEIRDILRDRPDVRV